MPYLDLLLLISSILSSFYCSFVVARIAFKTPIPMFYLFLSFSIFILGLNFLLVIPIFISEFSIFSSTFNLSQQQAFLILRISHFFAITFILSFSLISYAPLIKVSIKSISFVIFITMFTTATYIIDSFTITYSVSNDKIIINYNILGEFFLVISLALLVLILTIRYREIQTTLVTSKRVLHTFTSGKARRNFYILIILIIGSFVLGRQFGFLPTYLWAGFTSIGVLYLAHSFKNDKAFYFISNTKLEAVIVLNSLSGKVQFYKNFQNVDMLITSVMTAFNISIKNLISSNTDIQQIFFEDKALLLKKGEFTTTILFVNEKSIISDNITNFLAKTFEKNYQVILKANLNGVDDLKLFLSFSNDIDQILHYFTSP